MIDSAYYLMLTMKHLIHVNGGVCDPLGVFCFPTTAYVVMWMDSSWKDYGPLGAQMKWW